MTTISIRKPYGNTYISIATNDIMLCRKRKGNQIEFYEIIKDFKNKKDFLIFSSFIMNFIDPHKCSMFKYQKIRIIYIEKNPWERDIDVRTQMPIGITFHILNKFSFPNASKGEKLTNFDIIKRKESFISYQRVAITYCGHLFFHKLS
jgi:hypothetical protein